MVVFIWSRLFLQDDNNAVCDDCVKFLTDAQAEAKSNTSFIDGLIENLENQCDLLGPGIADMVRTLIPFFFFS